MIKSVSFKSLSEDDSNNFNKTTDAANGIEQSIRPAV